MALTVPKTTLKGGGGYTTTTPTKKGSAGILKPMGGGVAGKRKAGTLNVNHIFQGDGRSGSTTPLKTPRSVVQ